MPKVLTKLGFVGSIVAGVIGYALTLYGIRKIAEGGLRADALGISGAITIDEAVPALLGAVLSLTSIVLFIKSTKKDADGDPRLMYSATVALILLTFSAYIFLLAIPSLAIAARTAVLSGHFKSGGVYVAQCRIMSLYVGIMSLVTILLAILSFL